jgi:hypothetical protein
MTNILFSWRFGKSFGKAKTELKPILRIWEPIPAAPFFLTTLFKRTPAPRRDAHRHVIAESGKAMFVDQAKSVNLGTGIGNFWSFVLAHGAPANDCVSGEKPHPVRPRFAYVALGRVNAAEFVLLLVDRYGASHVVGRFADDTEIYAEWLNLARRLGLPRYCIVEGGIAVPFDPDARPASPRRRAHVMAKRRPRFLATRKQSQLTYSNSLTPTTPDRRSNGR